MLKILIADDHPIVRSGLKKILEKAGDMVVTDEASTGEEALDKIYKNDCFDILLLDISMPGRGGLDVLSQLQKEKPNLPVLILSMHSEEQYAKRALKLGASGYLTKASAPAELITAIRTVAIGRKYISSSLAEQLAVVLHRDHEKPLHETLSTREFQVMNMIAHGKSLSQIARELSLSVKTISTYRTRIMKKMEMKNNAELTIYAVQNNFSINFLPNYSG